MAFLKIIFARKEKGKTNECNFYKTLHIFSLLLVFLAIGQMITSKDKSYKLPYMMHGIGVLLVLVAGFGMLAKLKIGFTTWTYMKLGTWLAVAASPGFVKRAPFRKPLMSLIILAIGLFGVYTAIYK